MMAYGARFLSFSLLFISLILEVAGCGPVGTGTMNPGSPGAKNDPPAASRAVDLLFLVDDSESMIVLQDTLIQNFPTFAQVLTALPGGAPDLRLAITTSSLGAGAFGLQVLGCDTSNEGRFIDQPRDTTDRACDTARITGPEHFVISNGATKNFSGDLATVFKCLAKVGDRGCGFEHQLASVRAALGDPAMGLKPPPGNEGFLRDDALLVVIVLTNEDDCSMPPDSHLTDPSSAKITDPLGPNASFRCTEYGILCDGRKPPRMMTGPLHNCVSNDGAAQSDPTHALIPAQFFVDYFRRLKKDPNRLVVAAIAAPVDPFSVGINPGPRPILDHSCASGTNLGDPPIRIKQVLDALGGQFRPNICDASYRGPMQDIANLIAMRLGS